MYGVVHNIAAKLSALWTVQVPANTAQKPGIRKHRAPVVDVIIVSFAVLGSNGLAEKKSGTESENSCKNQCTYTCREHDTGVHLWSPCHMCRYLE